MSTTTTKLRNQKPGETCYYDNIDVTFAFRDHVMKQIIAQMPDKLRSSICFLELTMSVKVYKSVEPDQLLPEPAQQESKP